MKAQKRNPFSVYRFSFLLRLSAPGKHQKWQHQQLIWLLLARVQSMALLAGGDAVLAIAHDARP